MSHKLASSPEKTSNMLVSKPDEMTAEWFTAVLGRADILAGGRVESVEIEPFGGGVMTNMARAKLTYAGVSSAPASLLIKFPSYDEGNLEVVRLTGMYELEVHFYRDIAPRLTNMSLPKSYFAQIDEQTGRFTLVLEDLSAITRPGIERETLTQEECAAVFAELAKFQASFWNSPVLAEFEWLDPSRTHRFFDAFPAALDPFLKRFGPDLNSEQVKLFETVMPGAGKWARSWQPPTVLQHAEFRSANVLFGTTAGAPPVTIIDFQTVRVGPSGMDPAYFMACSLPTEDRRKMERDVVKDYHHRLLSAGVKDFDWDSCWRTYCEGAIGGVIFYGGAAGQVESNERNNKILISLIRRLADMAIDLDAAKAAGFS